MAIREMPDSYVKEKHRIEPERTSFFARELQDIPSNGYRQVVYGVYRKTAPGFVLEGDGDAEIVSFRIRDSILLDILTL